MFVTAEASSVLGDAESPGARRSWCFVLEDICLVGALVGEKKLRASPNVPLALGCLLIIL